MARENGLVFRYLFFILILQIFTPGVRAGEPADSTESSQFRDIISQALKFSPELKSFQASLKSLQSEIRTSALGPQSEIEFEVEEFGLDGGSISDSEMTVIWGRELEPSTLRQKTIALAKRTYEQQKALGLDQILQFLGNVSRVYFDVAGREMELTLASETVSLAAEMLEVARNRVSTGAAPGLEEERSQMEYDLALIHESKAKNTVYAAKSKLASFLNCPVEKIEVTPLKEMTSPVILSYENGVQVPDDHFLIKAAEAAIEKAKAQIHIVSIESRTQLKAMAGFRHNGDLSENSFLMGFSIPLGTGRRNQSKRETARSLLTAQEHSLKAREIELKRTIDQALLQVKAAKSEFSAIENLMLPAAERIFKSVKEGYLRGELKYTDLLVAKQSLVDVAGQRVAALLALRLALLELDMANGGSKTMKDVISEALK